MAQPLPINTKSVVAYKQVLLRFEKHREGFVQVRVLSVFQRLSRKDWELTDLSWNESVLWLRWMRTIFWHARGRPEIPSCWVVTKEFPIGVCWKNVEGLVYRRLKTCQYQTGRRKSWDLNDKDGRMMWMKACSQQNHQVERSEGMASKTKQQKKCSV